MMNAKDMKHSWLNGSDRSSIPGDSTASVIHNNITVNLSLSSSEDMAAFASVLDMMAKQEPSNIVASQDVAQDGYLNLRQATGASIDKFLDGTLKKSRMEDVWLDTDDEPPRRPKSENVEPELRFSPINSAANNWEQGPVSPQATALQSPSDTDTEDPSKWFCPQCKRNVPDCMLKCFHSFCELCIKQIKSETGRCPVANCDTKFRKWKKIYI